MIILNWVLVALFVFLLFVVVFKANACETQTLVIDGKVLVCTRCGDATYCA